MGNSSEMKITKKTVLNILPILLVLSFFVTPLGYHGKVWLNRLFASKPDIIELTERKQLLDYDWRLKDANWEYFNFKKSKGKVVFINFWTSWNTPSAAELKDIQELYDGYADRIDFYIITDEERAPVENFMRKNDFTFPVTYQIIGEPSPIEILKPGSTYIIDKNGSIVVKRDEIADWNNDTVYQLLKEQLDSK